MKVRELIDLLSTVDPEAEVVAAGEAVTSADELPAYYDGALLIIDHDNGRERPPTGARLVKSGVKVDLAPMGLPMLLQCWPDLPVAVEDQHDEPYVARVRQRAHNLQQEGERNMFLSWAAARFILRAEAEAAFVRRSWRDQMPEDILNLKGPEGYPLSYANRRYAQYDRELAAWVAKHQLPEKLYTRLTELRGLEDDWDDNDAPAPTLEYHLRVTPWIKRVAAAIDPIPLRVFPTVRGGLQVEWTRPDGKAAELDFYPVPLTSALTIHLLGLADGDDDVETQDFDVALAWVQKVSAPTT
jgi:hypothetical protein